MSLEHNRTTGGGRQQPSDESHEDRDETREDRDERTRRPPPDDVDTQLDEELEESFPASDPPSLTQDPQ